MDDDFKEVSKQEFWDHIIGKKLDVHPHVTYNRGDPVMTIHMKSRVGYGYIHGIVKDYLSPVSRSEYYLRRRYAE